MKHRKRTHLSFMLVVVQKVSVRNVVSFKIEERKLDGSQSPVTECSRATRSVGRTLHWTEMLGFRSNA